MDNCNGINVTNIEEEQKSGKITYKRRSSVFMTRVITFNQDDDNEAVNCEENQNSSKAEENKNQSEAPANADEKDTFDLQEYINKLEEERKSWQGTLKERRSQRKALARQKSCVEIQGQDLDLNILLDSEKSFLMARPNYEHICKNFKKLSDTAFKVAVLDQLVRKLNYRFMSRMNENLYRTTREVIRLSES